VLTTSGTIVNDNSVPRQQKRLRRLRTQAEVLSEGAGPQSAAIDP
jgi:hypothetical protein